MAFFNELGKKIAKVGQATAQKTKEIGEVSKINMLISDEEKKISDNVFQIGMLYFKLHHMDCESDFEELINSIKKSQQTIIEAKQQLKDIKGVTVHCEKCGAEVNSNMAFCTTCGNKMSGEESDRDKCPECGASVPKGMKFCTSCGKPMPTQADAVSEEAPSANEDAEKPAENAMPEQGEEESSFKICSSCGAKVSCENSFCTECGNKL